jgi:phosphoesterase RecJ-like protein
LDVNTSDRIAQDQVYKDAAYKICIDHHLYSENNEFDYVYVDNKASACCEILAEMFLKSKKKMNKDVCKYLYAGLSFDSGNFYYPSTTPKTLNLGAKLMEIGDFNPYNEIHMIVGMKSLKDLEVANYLFSKIVVDEDGFAYYENSLEDLEKMKVTASGANEKISEFNKVEEIKIFLAASECEDHTFRCSLRSKNISIVEVAQKYGGGGHNLASGIKNISKEDLEKLKEDLLKLTK